MHTDTRYHLCRLKLTPVRLLSALVLCLALNQPATSQAEVEQAGLNQPELVDQELRQFLKTTIEISSSFEDRFDAEVWLLSKQEQMARFIDDPGHRMDMLQRIHRAARSVGLQPEIVLAVIEVESNFNRYALSRAGAQGMMQVMPFWKNEIGHPDDNLIDIDTNLRYGCAILKHYMNKTNGRLMDALARYNGSYGEYWYPRRVMDAWQNHWR